MFLLKLALSALLLAQTASGAIIAGFNASSDVTDYLRFDLDVKFLSAYVDRLNQSGYDDAKNLYTKGAHYRPQATVSVPAGLSVALSRGESLYGNGTTLSPIRLTVAAATGVNATQLVLSYAGDRFCAVGGLGLAEQTTSGCLNETGVLFTNTSVPIPYQYTLATGNTNGRTLQYLSATANTTMRPNSTLPYYAEFQKFLDYYGNTDYGDKWILAALDAKPTNFANGLGNADFSNSSFAGRGQAIKKGAPYMNALMYAIYELEAASRSCSERALTETVGLYTGSVEGENGTLGSGFMSYALANKRCQNFKTCGPDGNATTGNSKVNIDIFDQFKLIQQNARTFNCSEIPASRKRILELMSVPPVQATLRYTYIVSLGTASEAGRVELAAFAASVLPLVHACSPADAALIYNNVRVGAPSTNFAAVKLAFERNYACMGITCKEVGGLFDGAAGGYYSGAAPCGLLSPPTSRPTLQPASRPTSLCTNPGAKCVRRTQCCGLAAKNTCDGPTPQTRRCKACLKARARCIRTSQCCPGLRCNKKKCVK